MAPYYASGGGQQPPINHRTTCQTAPIVSIGLDCDWAWQSQVLQVACLYRGLHITVWFTGCPQVPRLDLRQPQKTLLKNVQNKVNPIQAIVWCDRVREMACKESQQQKSDNCLGIYIKLK